MSRARVAAVALASALAAGVAHADRLHLEGGGVIDADRWWIEGETLHVESAEGSVGLPRSMLRRVERTEPADKKKAQAPAAAPKVELPKARASSDAAETMKRANEALLARNFESASRGFRDVVDLVPGEPGPRVGYAVAEMALGRDAMALPVVLDGLVRTPDDPQLLEVLGDLRYRDERVDEALTSWREAFRLAPADHLRDKIVKAEREQTAGRDYAFSAAAHFNLRYDGAVDADLVASLTDFLEDRYRKLSSVYRHVLSQPVTVLVYPKQEFHDVTQSGAEVAGLYDGKIRVPLGGLRRLGPDAERVLAHELTHAIVHSKTRGNCPRWLQEGLAQISEERPLKRSDLAQIARSLRAETPSTWPDAAFSYPSALAFTRFLESRRGFDVLVSVLDRLGDGDSLDAALSASYGATYAELAAEWANSLEGRAP